MGGSKDSVERRPLSSAHLPHSTGPRIRGYIRSRLCIARTASRVPCTLPRRLALLEKWMNQINCSRTDAELVLVYYKSAAVGDRVILASTPTVRKIGYPG